MESARSGRQNGVSRGNWMVDNAATVDPDQRRSSTQLEGYPEALLRGSGRGDQRRVPGAAERHSPGVGRTGSKTVEALLR